MDVVVIGAGLAGLSLAHGFQQSGARTMVVEQAPADRPQGNGLSLMPNGLTALHALGLGPQLEQLTRGHSPAGGGQRTPDGRWLYRLPARAVGSVRVVHRAELHAVLVQALVPGTVRFGVRATLVDPLTGQVQLQGPGIDDDPSGGGDEDPMVRADLVVCADGLRSRARAAIGSDPGIRYAGYGAWRGVTPAAVPGVEPSETWGRGLRFGLVPLPDNRVYWFAVRNGPPTATAQDAHREVLDLFGTWHDPIRRVVESTDAATITWSPIEELARPLTTLFRGVSVLVGDAAHAMTPNLGQGGNQGLEDAATLVRLLTRSAAGAPDRQVLAQLLARYDELRRPRTQRIARLSRQLGRIASTEQALLAIGRDALLRLTPTRAAAASIDALADWRPPEVGDGVVPPATRPTLSA